MKRIAMKDYTDTSGVVYTVKKFHKKFHQVHYFKIYRTGVLHASGDCPKWATTQNIFQFYQQGKFPTK